MRLFRMVLCSLLFSSTALIFYAVTGIASEESLGERVTRLEARQESVYERLKGNDDVHIEARLKVLEASIAQLQADRETDRKMNLGTLGGILTLLLNAGYQIRLSMRKGKEE